MSLPYVQRQSLPLGALRLANGTTLPEVELAYETYGTLAADRGNAVLVTHGYTSSAHAAGRYGPDDAYPGWWDGVIGPGKAIDTDRFFVVCSNMLGSSFGSTGPGSIDRRTGQPYGPDFPEIELVDIVTAQARLLEALGISRLIAVAGVSYGGFQAFQWGITFPDRMRGLVAVSTAPRGRGAGSVESIASMLAADPRWNGGRYYDRGGIFETLLAQRLGTLRRYGYTEALSRAVPDPAMRDAALKQLAQEWARVFDGNSLLTLGRAAARFDATAEFARIRAKLLYVLSTTDQLFPTSLAPEVMSKLEAAGVDARYFELASEHGHIASTTEPEKWAPVLRQFLEALA